MELFDQEDTQQANPVPLALICAPMNLHEFIGQQHLTGPGAPLRVAIETKTALNAIFFGPPGCGKTALARVIARSLGMAYVEFSCVSAGIAKIKEAIQQAEIRRANNRTPTLLVLDEIHHLNRTQQDVLLPYMENGVVCVIGLTTENPFFYIHKAVLSRTLVYEFKSLRNEDIAAILNRTLQKLAQDKKVLNLRPEAQLYLIEFAGGDARKLLNAVEFISKTANRKTGAWSAESLKTLLGHRQHIYDRSQDKHYNAASAFIKSMRGSDPDAAVYWMAQMLAGGEDPRFIARRIVIAASEDVGNADPMALVLSQSAFHAVEMLGLPEGAIPLAQAAIYVACAPKSNAGYKALKAAQQEVEYGRPREVPAYLMDSHAPGHQEGYKYAHDYPGHFVEQVYMPDPKIFYHPTTQGFEKTIKERLNFLWKEKKNWNKN